ncbi:hypothetical protein ASG82_14580 [Mycobacterium sp. Soil538]|nr:hypothetical protein ASG82_14580 [Mycobacterium sp. Soil538]
MLSAALGGNLLDGSAATVKVNFVDADGVSLGSGMTTTQCERLGQPCLQSRSAKGECHRRTRQDCSQVV